MKGAALARALAAPDPAVRCYLFYGADEAGSRAHAKTLVAALGPEAERVDLTPAQLKADPALLADEAASTSLFGTVRYVRVDGAGDETLAAADALLTASAAGNPVLLIAGALRKDARLVKRLDGDRAAVVAASFVPEGVEANRMAIALARDARLSIDEDVARRLVDASGGDRAILASELEKLALYADADPARSVRITAAMIAAVGVDAAEADDSGVVDAVFAGDVRTLDRELARAGEAVPMIRAAARRALAVASARAEIERGVPVKAAADKAGRSLFWKDRDAVARDVGGWSAGRIAAAIDRLGAMERELKSNRGAAETAAHQALLAMARSVKRR